MVALAATRSPCQVIDVAIRVVTETSTDETTKIPASISEVCLGAGGFVEVWVTNVGPLQPGITGGTVDVMFASGVVEAIAIDHATHFDELVSGVITEGRVDDLGGATLDTGVAVAPLWALLARVSFTAVDEGMAMFSLTPGALGFAIAGGHPPLEFGTDVLLGPSQMVEVVRPVRLGDTDCDLDVDLDDFANLEACVTGPDPDPATPVLSGVCLLTDLDADGDVDLGDFGLLQRQFGNLP